MEFDNYINYERQAVSFIYQLPKIQQDCVNKIMIQIALLMLDNIQTDDIVHMSRSAANYIITNNIFEYHNMEKENLYQDVIRYYYIVYSNF